MSVKVQQRLEEIVRGVELLESNLPKRVDPASISLKAKIPFKAILYRETLIWRFTELCRCALEHFIKEQPAAAVTLTRAALESVAACWYLNRKIKGVIDTEKVGDIDLFLMRLVMGSKVHTEMPEAINVLTFIDKVDSEIEGFRQQYDELSEFCHPNWRGVLSLAVWKFVFSVSMPEKFLL